MSRSRYRFFLIAVPLVVALALPGAAEATFPGQNGKIAFSGCSPGACGVVAVNADGSERTQITDNPFSHTVCDRFGCFEEFGQDGNPHWSADGRHLAFSREGDIYRVRADGGGLTQLTATPALEYDAAWSPDGRRIAFTRSPAEDVEQLFVMNSDGTQVMQLAAVGDSPDLVAGRQQDRLRGCKPEPQQPSLQLLPRRPPDQPGRHWRPGNHGFAGTGPLRLRRSVVVAGRQRIAVTGARAAEPRLLQGGLRHLGHERGRQRASEPHPEHDRTGQFAARVLARRHEDRRRTQREARRHERGRERCVRCLRSRSGRPPGLATPSSRAAARDYKNSAQFCKAEREFWGDAFPGRYGGGSNAYGKCVSQKG